MLVEIKLQRVGQDHEFPLTTIEDIPKDDPVCAFASYWLHEAGLVHLELALVPRSRLDLE